MRKLRWYHPALALWFVIIVLSVLATPIMFDYGFEYFFGSAFGELLLILGVFWVLSKIYGVVVGKGKKGEQKKSLEREQ